MRLRRYDAGPEENYMTDAEHNALLNEFGNAVVRGMTQKGSDYSGNLKDMFKKRGLTDEEMTKIIREKFKFK
jgi:hypothetical protein